MLNANSPAFVPSNPDTWTIVSKMKHKPAPRPQKKGPPKYRAKNGDLWSPPKGWLSFYRCQSCREVMSKKDASKCPQRINMCGHITCAKCIVTSYLVELNPLCPVEGCGKCVNPRQKVAPEPVEILAGPTVTEEAVPKTPESPPKTPELEEDDFDEMCNGCHFDVYTCKCHLIDFCCPGCGSDGRCHCDNVQEEAEDWTHYCGRRECDGDCGTLSCGCIDTCRDRCGTKWW
jgi:hypothetical protein